MKTLKQEQLFFVAGAHIENHDHVDTTKTPVSTVVEPTEYVRVDGTLKLAFGCC